MIIFCNLDLQASSKWIFKNAQNWKTCLTFEVTSHFPFLNVVNETICGSLQTQELQKKPFQKNEELWRKF